MKHIGQMNIWEFVAKFTLVGTMISLVPLAVFIGGCQIKDKIDEWKTKRKEDDNE